MLYSSKNDISFKSFSGSPARLSVPVGYRSRLCHEHASNNSLAKPNNQFSPFGIKQAWLGTTESKEINFDNDQEPSCKQRMSKSMSKLISLS